MIKSSKFQVGNVIGSLPPVSYVKVIIIFMVLIDWNYLQSIDYFMFTCIAYIFGSLLEMAFIAYRVRCILVHSLMDK